MFILKKGHQPGVYVPLRALFLVRIVYESLRVGATSLFWPIKLSSYICESACERTAYPELQGKSLQTAVLSADQ